MQNIFTTLFAIMIGLIIVKIVDYRLSNISINMPKITLPDIVVNITDANGKFTVKASDAQSSAFKASDAQSSAPKASESQSSDAGFTSLSSPTATWRNQKGGSSGARYYLDPSEMTPKQLKLFREKAHIKNMTPLDYKNWLSVNTNRH
jgi:hypothetical protein